MLKIPEQYQEPHNKLTKLFNQKGTKIIITDRGLGKSKNAVLWILEQVICNQQEYAFLMRNWGDDNQKIKEYFKKVVDDFCLMWEGKEVKRKDFEIKDFETYYFGLLYKSKVRVYFYTLFDEGGSRNKHDKGASGMFLDEAIPTRFDSKKSGGGWQPDEALKYSEHEKSIKRNNSHIDKVFLGNPNCSFYECWFLNYWQKELEEFNKWYWANRPKGEKEWREWNWVKQWEKDGKILYLEKLPLEETEFASYEDGNWDNFFTRKEDLKIIEPINGSRPLYVFNGCVMYLAKKGFWYLANKEDKRLSNKEDLKYIKEYCIDREQRLKSQQLVKWDYDKDILRGELLDKHEKGRLFFADSSVKGIIEEFIGKGKV